MNNYYGSATYSPDDNKLRLYPFARLDKETYDRVKAAGFSWAPRQQLFVAGRWTPGREDLLLELCGEIDDEDKSLVDRAAERAERFEGYEERRSKEADSAYNHAKSIADGIPFGQPILVGHHSEKRARKDAERIQNGFSRAAKLWECSQYWQDRAAGAIANAKYKESKPVRARRIKTIEADKRKAEREIKECEHNLKLWQSLEDPEKWKKQDGSVLTLLERALYIANQGRNYDRYSALDKGTLEPLDAQAQAIKRIGNTIAFYQRCVDHYNNRIAYEKAMLEESGGLVAQKVELEVGGKVLAKGEWHLILRVNKKDGQAVSVTTTRRYVSVIGVENIKEYRAPEPGAAEKIKAAMKLPPICNYKGKDFVELTKAQWDAKHNDYKGTRVQDPTDQHGKHRLRFCLHGMKYQPVFITDIKAVPAPAPSLIEEDTVRVPISEPVPSSRPVYQPAPKNEKLEEAKAIAKSGPIEVVAVEQLFPTPIDLANKMADFAEIEPGMAILEPSAGTGVLIDAALAHGGEVTAVEWNVRLASRLKAKYANVHTADFLELNGELGKFDRVLMNPPFQNGADIKHIKHAIEKLKPGGVLVAICANGPRQQRELQPIAEHWEDLPAGTFKNAGTGVNTAMLVIRT